MGIENRIRKIEIGLTTAKKFMKEGKHDLAEAAMLKTMDLTGYRHVSEPIKEELKNGTFSNYEEGANKTYSVLKEVYEAERNKYSNTNNNLENIKYKVK